MKTPGQVQSVTVGSFTVQDADAVAGGGCTDIQLINNSSSQNAAVSVDQYDNFNDTGYGPLSPGESTASTFGNLVAAGFANVTFSSAELDGSSMISGLVGNSGSDATALQNGNIPCINVGGVAGT